MESKWLNSSQLDNPQASSSVESKINFKAESSSSSSKEQINDKLDQEVSDINFNQRVESGTKSSDKKPPERIKKKAPWYSALYPTYKSRSEDFKRIFRDLPPEERLIVDYSCAVQRDILVHGRLYISQNYLCFYANIFRWETQITVKWKDVTSVTKEKTALVIPNAILVATGTEKHFLTSFAARDKTYLMVFRVWQNALMDQPMSIQEIWQWVHTFYGDELGLTSDDDDYIPPRLPGEAKAITKQPCAESSSEDCAVIVNKETKTDEEVQEKCDAEWSILDQLPLDMSDNSEPELDRGSAATCPIVHEGRMLVHELVPLNVDELFTLIFTNSKFCADLHESRKNIDVKQSAWEVNPTSQQKTRYVSLTVPLAAAVGPKQSQVSETQVMLSCSKPGEMYVIEVESTNSGIPYADSFYIATHFCLTRGSHRFETSLSVYCQIKYRKSVWSLVKGFIEKNCWAGLEEFYTALVKALEAECQHHKVLEPTVEVIGSKAVRKRSKPDHTRDQPIATENRIYPQTSSSPSKVLQIDPIGWIVLSVLLVLVVLNIILYCKLWDIEEFDRRQRLPSIIDVHLQQQTPRTQEEWLVLLYKQENLHNSEIQHWQKVLKKVMLLLKEAEESLSELQSDLQLSVVKRVLSALKEINPESADSSTTSEKQEL